MSEIHQDRFPGDTEGAIMGDNGKQEEKESEDITISRKRHGQLINYESALARYISEYGPELMFVNMPQEPASEEQQT